MARIVLDSEIYRNYYLLMMMDIDSKKVRWFEMFDGKPFDVIEVVKILASHELISFNGNHFDMPLLGQVLAGANCAHVKSLVEKIIVEGKRPWELGLEPPAGINHIDLKIG